MKLLFALIFSLLLLSQPSAAYIDTSAAADETSATAGEQNTNLYRLNASNFEKIKKMQQIDNALAKNPNADMSNTQEIEDLLNNKKQMDLDAQAQLAQMYKETQERTKNKNSLIVKNSDIYQQIVKIAGFSVKDEAAVMNIKQKIRRR